MSDTLTKDTPKEKLPYEIPALHLDTIAAHAIYQCPYTEGQRVSFSSSNKVQDMLELGYLELECLSQGRTMLQLVQKLGDQKYGFCMRYAGERASFAPFEYKRVSDIMDRVDLHAFRWYAHG